MDIVRKSTLELMVKVGLIKCTNWSDFEHFFFFFLKAITW